MCPCMCMIKSRDYMIMNRIRTVSCYPGIGVTASGTMATFGVYEDVRGAVAV